MTIDKKTKTRAGKLSKSAKGVSFRPHVIPPKTIRLSSDQSQLPDDRQEAIRERIATEIDKTAQAEVTKHPAYHYPRNAEEYWKIVDEWWPELLELLYRYIPMSGYQDKNGDILTTTLAVHIEQIRHDRNPKIGDYFNAAWGAAPDNGSIHAQEGWGVLCDLCSECYVLYGDEQRPQ